MSAATDTFHLSRPRLDGPAERTVVEPWFTELAHATLNAYPEPNACPEPAAPLAPVEALPVRPARRRAPARRIAAAA